MPFPWKQLSLFGKNSLNNDGEMVKRIIAVGAHTSTSDAGGVNTKSVSGVKSTDTVVATMKSVGASPVTLVSVAAGTNSITFTFSGNPSTDHVVSFVVVRPA